MQTLVSRLSSLIKIKVIYFSGLMIFLMPACGEKAPKNKGGKPAHSKVEEAFLKAAEASAAAGNVVPLRFLKAVAWVESRMTAERARAAYISLDKGKEAVERGTILTDTAFGLTYKDLGLDPADPAAITIEKQVEAYATWVATRVKGFNLSSNPATAVEKYYWIENLANLHRQGVSRSRNVQILFARELMQALNEGFIWQDPRNGETMELSPEKPALTVQDFPENGQKWFELFKPDVEDEGVIGATYLPLVSVPSDEFRNVPRRIEVLHCPMSLSACLELQTRSGESEVYLGAHYYIPSDDNVFSKKIVKVLPHQKSIVLTNSLGENRPVEDAVIVMLVGQSGRNVGGSRQPAMPHWFSDYQLRLMAQLINEVCTSLAQKNPGQVKRDECMSIGGERGVRFRHQGQSEEYRWGDIADFDPTIFESYLRETGSARSEVAFSIPENALVFRSGQEIPLTVTFNSTARNVELERLSRCANGRVVWEPVRNQQMRGENKAVFPEIYYDSGANGNGDQFFRTRVYGKDGKLIGWAIKQIFLKNFEPEMTFASEKHCNG